jgi:hypothetical protein
MDGTQSPGINYNSIDGLTTVSANSIIINGSTINLANYVPYTGATTNVDLNTRLLRNIGNATSPQDAVALSQLGSYIPYTGAVSNPNFNTRVLTNIGDAITINDAVSLQQLNAYQPSQIRNGALSVFANAGLNDLTIQAAPIGRVISFSRTAINPTSNATDMFAVSNAAGTSIFTVDTTTPAINCNSVKLTNVANPTVSGDAVNLTTLQNFVQFKIEANPASGLSYAECITNNVNIGTGASGTISLLSRTKITPVSNTISTLLITNVANTPIFAVDTTTTAISCNTVINATSNKIINLANGTASGDAVNYGQLSTISSLITSGLPAGNLQGSYLLHNGTSYYNASTSRVSLGISSLNTNPTLLASTFGTVAIGALAANIDSGFHSLVATATINYDASGLTIGASNPTVTNTGTLGSSGTKSSGAGNATVVNSGIIGSLNELSVPSNCVYQFGTGAGLTYPNMTVAAVFRTPSSNGFFIEHGFNYNTNPSFYLSNGIPYFGGPTYYTNQCVGASTAPALDDFQTTTPRNIAGTNGFGAGLGTESYTIAIMTFSATATIFQCYLIPTNNTAILNQTQYGPYTKTYAAMGSSTNASNLIYINRRNAQAQILCQMLVFNQTFSQEQVSQLQSYLRMKWFSNISGNLSNNISVGYASGFSRQSFNSVAVGPWAGSSSQGIYSVAIGNKAGQSSQPDYSIVINGMESALNPTTSGLFINPVRQVPFAEPRPRGLMYKIDTKEIVYNETTIWNVIIIGQAASNPSATLPLVYFMPTGVRVDSSSYTCTVVRNLQGDYTLTFPASANPNFGTYTTITTGVNARISAGSNLCIAKWTSSNTIDINYVYAAVAWVDLMVGTNISLRIEF